MIATYEYMLVVTHGLVILRNVCHLEAIVGLLGLSLGQYWAKLGQSWAIFGGLGGLVWSI